MSNTSPYHTESYKVKYQDGEVSLERWGHNNLEDSGIVHTVLDGQTLQEISYIYYRDSGRWGDIATFNDIYDPFELEIGSSIIIPK